MVPRRVRAVRAVAGSLASAIAVVAACGDTGEPTAPWDAPAGALAHSSEVEYDGARLELGVSISALEISAGDPLTIGLSVRNPHAYVVQLSFSSTCQLVYGIEAPAGELVAPPGGGWICGAAITRLSLGPGESVSQTVTWNAHRYANGSWEPVPAGIYRVFAALGQGMNARSGAVRLEVRE